MTTNPIRLDRLQAGMVAAVRARAPVGASVQWSKSKYPHGLMTAMHLNIDLVGGPSPRADRNHAAVYSAVLPLEITLAVGGTLTEGDTLILHVSGRTFRADVEAGDTVETLRNRMLAALSVEPMVDATFVAFGSTSIDIDALEYGDLYNVTVRGPATFTVGVSSLCKVQEDSVRCEVEIQAYSDSPDIMTGAHAALSRITQALELPAQARILEAHGLVVAPANVVDLSTLAGPEWETRSAVTLSVYLPAVAAEPIDAVQTAGMSLIVRDLPGAETLTVETP